MEWLLKVKVKVTEIPWEELSLVINMYAAADGRVINASTWETME